MIPSILLALTVIIAMVDVLVGIHRGFGFGVIRFLIWIAGTVVCMLLARPVTIWLLLKIAKVPDMKIFTFDVFGGFLGDTKDTIGTHLTGTTVSFLVPIVFVALFIISKLITWIIYCIVKHIIKKNAKKDEAHNAAVDAVKAIEHMELPNAESIEGPVIPKPSFDEEKPADFGTFGIYPKEEEKEEDKEEPFGIYPDNVTAGSDNAMIESETDQKDLLEASGSEEKSSTLASEQAEEITDGFEAIAASSEDGFESLAKSQRIEAAKEKKPAKPKKLKRRKSLSIFLMKETLASKALGGVLGLFVSLFACAIVMIPVTQIFKIISTKEEAEAVVDLAFTLSKMDTEGFFDRALEESDRPAPIIQKEIELTGDISIRAQDFVEMFTDGDKSIVYSIYKYSGANAIASFIYDRLTPVDVKDIKLENKGIKEYNFPDTLSCYVGLAPRVKELIDVINHGKGVSVELVNDIEDCLDFIIVDRGKGEILTKNDKLALVNTFIDGMNKRLEQSPIVAQSQTSVIVLDNFSEYDEMRAGLSNLFDMVRRLISAGLLE